MRADIYLFTYGYTKSRQAAKTLIISGDVLIDGENLIKPSMDISENSDHTIEILNKPRFVSRGGEKLDYAIEKFNINVKDLVCIDIGASTGGFTDCLLQLGAAKVYAVDSGHSQLDPVIQESTKVVSIEGYNARFMRSDDFPQRFDLAVMDVSFISQTMIHRGIADVLSENGILVSLIKPQFECGRAGLNSQGIVKKATDRINCINRVLDSALICGFSCLDLVRSPIEGGSGNIEYLAFFKKSDTPKIHISESLIKNIAQAK